MRSRIKEARSGSEQSRYGGKRKIEFEVNGCMAFRMADRHEYDTIVTLSEDPTIPHWLRLDTNVADECRAIMTTWVRTSCSSRGRKGLTFLHSAVRCGASYSIRERHQVQHWAQMQWPSHGIRTATFISYRSFRDLLGLMSREEHAVNVGRQIGSK